MNKAINASPLTRIQLGTFVINMSTVALLPLTTYSLTNSLSMLTTLGTCYFILSVLYIKHLPFYRRLGNCMVCIVDVIITYSMQVLH